MDAGNTTAGDREESAELRTQVSDSERGDSERIVLYKNQNTRCSGFWNIGITTQGWAI